MTKINISKPTGKEVNTLLSAFVADNHTYVIFDAERMGSMGLPIIYISKYTDKLEKINDDNEWQSVKNYLKGIINGTNFQYIKMKEELMADEVYYTPLTLPQASFDMIKSRYVVEEDTSSGNEVVLEPTVTPEALTPAIEPVVTQNEAEAPVEIVSPVMPSSEVISNEVVSTTPIVEEVPTFDVSLNKEEAPVIEPVVQQTEVPQIEEKEEVSSPEVPNLDSIFYQDKETFLKACENMFDALVSKYQKKLEEITLKEQELKNKEIEIESKLKNANEHLANAEAREQVANIAHDNAQKVMDITNLMPNNPNSNPTGVI